MGRLTEAISVFNLECNPCNEEDLQQITALDVDEAKQIRKHGLTAQKTR